MDKYKRLKHGEASFTLEERFDDVEKAANPSTEGEFVEIKISNLKIDFVSRTPNSGAMLKLSTPAAILFLMSSADK